MDFKGTKGQWFIDYSEQYMNGSNVLCTPISTNQVINLCDVYGDDDTAKSNALLISKSPLLLKAIKDSINELREVGLNDMANYHEKLYNECVNL